MTRRGEQDRARRKLALFLVLALIFALAILVPRLLIAPGDGFWSTARGALLADAAKMWSVGIAGLVTLLAIDRSLADLGLNGCPARYLVLAAAAPMAYGMLVYGSAWLSGLAGFGGVGFLVERSGAAMLHLPLALVFAAGEEIGWRGVLVPNLARSAGAAVTALVPVAIWAVWHWPDIVLLGYNVGTPYELACLSVSLIGLGAYLGWLRLASRSLWSAVICHGAHNVLMWTVFETVTVNGPFTAYATTEFGIGLSLLSVLLGVASWRGLVPLVDIRQARAHDMPCRP
jgi:membrane protease YdiL (CAAX protease family)